MSKALFITEKPSVAAEFAKALKINGRKSDGFIESDKAVVTWCVGHLVTMSYPEKYDIKLKKWSLNTLPFLPKSYKYEVIEGVKKQFNIVKSQLLREDIDRIYVCTDSGREGEYIYRLVDEMAGCPDKQKRRVWIDSQTEAEIIRGVKEAKDLSAYDNLSEAAYLRAKEDYLMGINFSRLLSLVYGKTVSTYLGKSYIVIAVGRVMSCVLGMVVQREREVREFTVTPFYRIIGSFNVSEDCNYDGEWKAVEGSKYFESPILYNEGGFKTQEDAENLIGELRDSSIDNNVLVENISKKKENKNAPLLFNLAEMQNECSKKFKINPEQTLSLIQALYEKKMLTYPRTDARVLSTAISKEIDQNIKKLMKLNGNTEINNIAKNIIEKKWYSGIAKTKYVDDSKVTDHYAIIPTGEGLQNYSSLKEMEKKVYNLVLRRFLAIFYPPAVYNKVSVITKINKERFFTSDKVCVELGYLEVLKPDNESNDRESTNMKFLSLLKKGQTVTLKELVVKEGKTSPPKRFTTGSIIIAMENAGKLIEDEELREHIKGSGIGTSATRSGILTKLEKIEYIKSNNKTQVVMPTLLGEIIFDVVKNSIPTLLNPELTASWEKGLTMVTQSEIPGDIYMDKLENYIVKNTDRVLQLNNGLRLKSKFDMASEFY
ncbi:DNA topoisomerase [Clostridium estertheticum]|uniref:DNA topoisomerase n=1 Tax=Clostridium estertheticum subsp. estertheticum TaxID=1552 RepID=A0A1J0GMY0_9CLOT|nr:DNA topoisomerase [Clostridium estertheticum]APC42732.1 DNA topoisomerase III [Clostridium estertheticum subsp. estertheticum]MBU3072868.1 type IA DNA topoisomerase [Clostridium estertheticum]MBU3163095.1 type IA DNA topoisomerase [Clostridium estertheticum]MBU3172666.1 type IA DNA topoisomerase [Clostridium estertheticum]MBU3183829.1 type IA DNA topoisomerase [Clostridium estertheticum]